MCAAPVNQPNVNLAVLQMKTQMMAFLTITNQARRNTSGGALRTFHTFLPAAEVTSGAAARGARGDSHAGLIVQAGRLVISTVYILRVFV